MYLSFSTIFLQFAYDTKYFLSIKKIFEFNMQEKKLKFDSWTNFALKMLANNINTPMGAFLRLYKVKAGFL